MRRVEFLGMEVSVKNADVKIIEKTVIQIEIDLKIAIDDVNKGNFVQAVQRKASADALIDLLHSLEVVSTKAWAKMGRDAFDWLYDRGYFEELHKREMYEMLYGR